jgi:Conjugal transfer protein TraD
MTMLGKLENKKKKLDSEIEKNLLRKKILLTQEKKKRTAKFSQVGKLAYQANIDQLEETALLGAFLEIAKAKENEEQIIKWQIQAEEFLNQQSKKSGQYVSIYFLEEPSSEVKKSLKVNKFYWNRFRKEFYGKAEKSYIENLLQGCKYKIEEINHSA